MSTAKLLAILLIVGGVLGLVYGSLSIVTGHHALDLGVVQLSTWDRQRIYVPVWVGVASVALGSALLYNGKRP
jgi:hypothetical protein